MAIYSNRKKVPQNNEVVNESTMYGQNVSSEGDYSLINEENTVDFKGLTPEELYGFSPDLGMARSEDLSNSDYSNFFRNPEVKKAFTEHLDLTDDLTRKAVIVMNEAEQTSVLTALTSKLYDNIVSKVDDIDFGEIPMTKGDDVREFIRAGIPLQLNVDSFLSFRKRAKSLEWIDNGCAARIGSDIHGAKKLYAPWLKCKKYILKKLDGKI